MLAGTEQTGSSLAFATTRLTVDGTPDDSFGPDGRRVTQFPPVCSATAAIRPGTSPSR